MGNKMKKLICSLLAAAMLVTSAGVVAFAADPDAADDGSADAEVTETVTEVSESETTAAEETADTVEATETEATAAAEATPAPAPVETTTTSSSSSSYDDDEYYERALSLCSSLGIISGYEDGSVRPESNVTRAEMASIVLRTLALTSTSTYNNVFTDVDASHWAATQIQSAYEAGIINGMGDGTFQPDSNVTYAQVIVMLVNAMNYQDDAEYYGGYPDGYIKVAGSTPLQLLKSAPGQSDVASDRGTVIKMVYNALLGDYKKITGYENGYPTYGTDDNHPSLAYAKFDVIDQKGVLLGTAKTSISTTDIEDGQIEILPDKEDDSIVYDTKLNDLEEYLALKITYYYRENSGLTPEVLAVTYDSSKSEVYTIDDLDTIESVTGFEDGAGQIKIEKVSKTKKCSNDVIIVYNGKILDVDIVEANGDDINDLINPELGSIKLVNMDKSDDTYDVVFVDSYETLVVSSATDTKLIGKVQDPDKEVGETKNVTYNLDDTVDRTITVTRGGAAAKVRNLKKNDVASIKASYDTDLVSSSISPEVIDVVVTGESITGSATGVSKKMDSSYATINGTKYDVANVAVGSLQTGAQCTFYFDMFGNIGYIDGATGGRLQSGEQYGWVMEQYKADGSSDKVLKVMGQDGKVHEYTYASSVKYWAPQALVGDENAGVTLSKKEAEATIQDLVDNDGFAHMWNDARQSTGTATHFDRPHICTPGAQINLIKYKANSSGKLTEVYCAVNCVNLSPYLYQENYNASDNDILNQKYITDPYLSDEDIAAIKASDALIFDQTSHASSTLVGGLVGGYVITSDIIEFQVPNDEDAYTKDESYTVGNVNADRYNVRESGLSDTWIVADQDGTTPGTIIRFVPDSSEPVSPGDLDSVSTSPSAMVIDSIDSAVDDDDNDVYIINGYTAGSLTSVKTKETSALAELTGWNSTTKKYATGDVLWTGKTGESLANYLHEGDIVMTDGTYILLVESAQNVYECLREGDTDSFFKTIYPSETRNQFYFNYVYDADVDDVAWMTIGSNKFSADASFSMDVVEIDLSKTASRAISINDDLDTISDLYPYGTDPDEYDYGFVRFANKGALQEVIIYRIKNASFIGIDAVTDDVQ